MTGDAVVRPLTEAEESAALDLVFSTWPEIPREAQAEMVRRDPWRAEQRTYGAVLDGELISHARFHFRPVTLQGCSLRMIGVCEVTTHPNHRRRGLGHRVLRAALDWMRSAGHHFVLLHTGVNAFYQPLGWGTLDLPRDYHPLASVPRLGTGSCEIERGSIFASPPELPAVYDESCGRHALALKRTPTYWQSWPHWAKDNLWFGLLDNQWTVARRGGRVVAYGGLHWSLQREATPSIREAGALPGHEDALLDVFDDLVARARQVSASDAALELNLPGDHPYVSRLASGSDHARNAGVMGQILDLRALLTALAPALNSRAVALRGNVAITLSSPPHRTTVVAAPGQVSLSDAAGDVRVDLTAAGLACLVLGCRSASDLATAGELQVNGSSHEELDILFPCLHSHYWQIDHF